MKPLTVIKVAGPVMFIGGLLFLFFMVWIPLNANLRRDNILSGYHLNVAFFITHVAPNIALAAWMMATAVGILRFRPWARISILVLSFHAIYFAAGFLVIMRMVVSNPSAEQPWAQVIWFSLPLSIAGIAGVWVVQFADEDMDSIFLPPRAAKLDQQNSPNSNLLFDEASAVSMPPLSLSVIAGWLLVLWPIRLYQLLLTPRASGPLFPAFPIGIVLHEPQRSAYLVAITLTGAGFGVGLLRAREWGRVGAMALCLFSILSTAAMAIRPYAFGQAADLLHSSGAGWISPTFFWFANLWDAWLPITALYFLITRRSAFRNRQPAMTP